MPEADFLVKTYDNKYVFVELESPLDKLNSPFISCNIPIEREKPTVRGMSVLGFL